MDEHEGESMVFVPTFLKIKVGDEVTFIPQDEGHTSRSLHQPKEAKSWKGGDGEKITVKFEKEGLYIYDCENHGVMGMIGMIQVGGDSNREEAKKFYVTHKNKMVMNNERLDKYLIKK